MALTSSLFVRPSLTYSRTRNGTTQQWIPPFGSATITYASGTGSAQMNRVYDSQRTLAASATEELDLFDGTLLDAFEQAIVFVKAKLLYVKAATGNTNNVEVGGAGSNTFLGPFKDATDKIVLLPGDVALIANLTTGWTVSATVKRLLVANSAGGTGVTYDILIAGTDA